MSTINLVHGDNFSFIENESIDLVLTDPPFNISRETNFATFDKNTVHSYSFDQGSKEKWDTVEHCEFLQLMDSWAVEWSRVLRKGGSFAIFCADSYVSHLWESLNKSGLSPSRLFVWRKNNAVPVNRKYIPMSANEYIIVGAKKGGKRTFNSTIPLSEINLSDKRIVEATIVADKVASIVNRGVAKALLSRDCKDTFDDHASQVVDSVFTAINSSESEIKKKVRNFYKSVDGEIEFQACIPNNVEFPLRTGKRIHPTQKNHDLLLYLISLFSNSGDIVLDGFSGSGSTGCAAYELDRNVILVERESEFYKKSAQWLSPLSGSDLVLSTIGERP